MTNNSSCTLDIDGLIRMMCPDADCQWKLVSVGEPDTYSPSQSKPIFADGVPKKRTHEQELDAVLYVSVVLLVYALIIMLMIASNIRRQRFEAEEADYYEEFLQKRDQFKNEKLYEETKKLQNNPICMSNSSNGKDGRAPIITIASL